MHTSELALVFEVAQGKQPPPPDWCLAASLVSAVSTV